MARFRVPHTLVLLFGMCVVALLLTRVLPQGRFQRVDADGHDVVVAGSYERITASSDGEDQRLGWEALFTSIPKGFSAAQDIIFFIFLVGGCFGVLRATGAADAGISAVLARLGHQPAWLIGGATAVFAIGSSTIGMAEEYIPFVPVLLVLCAGLGLDAMTAVAIICVGMGVGYGAAAINPFTVLVAQKIAGLEPISGLWFRLVVFPVFLAVGIHHVLRYARRVREQPSCSLVHDLAIEASEPDRSVVFSWRHKLVLLITAAAIGLLVYGIKQHDWYLAEMGALFIGLTIVYGVVARMHPNRVAEDFCRGAADLTTTALLVGVARSIQVILADGLVVDTIVHAIATPLGQLGSHAAAVGMFAVQSLCNFFVPSGSGQAYVTMPVMTPLADLVGVPRQVAVLAYQFGDGFTNIIVPTNAVLIGILTMARVPYDRWLRFVMPLMIKLGILGVLALIAAMLIGYGA